MSEVSPGDGSPSEGLPAATPLDEWLDRLAQPTGVPGGGAASGVMLVLAAGLLRMVAEYSPEDPEAASAGVRLAELRRRALTAAEEDGARSGALGAALAAPDDDPERDERLREAALAAARSAAALGDVGVALAAEAARVRRVGKRSLTADLDVAAEALAAGIAGALITLRAGIDLVDAHRGGCDGADAPLRSLAERADRLAAARDAVRAAA